ncbi:MAG: hypothetical protein JXQ73_26040 [Phycisphaerae bacterium]|nr:hypothetical protein [Phycisphaerae bacterium]
MRIVTGTTNERLARAGIMTLALLAFAVWFAVDGLYRYPRKALEPFMVDLKLTELPVPHPKLGYAYPEEPKKKYEQGAKEGLTKSEVLADLGEPLKVEHDVATKNDFWHYVGRYGRLSLEVQRTEDPNVGNVIAAQWEETSSDYRYESVRQQQFWSIVCAVAGLVGVVWTIRTWRTRVTVDDTGLSYDRLTIPWDSMIELDSDAYHEKGWVKLTYASGQSERRIKLDSFKIEAYDEIITAICDRKGFANPIPIDEYIDETEAPDEGSDESAPE